MKRSKFNALLLSFAIAVGLWLYVVTNVSVEYDTTFHDIPVQFEGETALEERGLMVTSGTDATVDLRLYGSRSNLNNLSAQNITIKVDLSRIYDPGTHEVGYDISYPSDVPSNAFETLSKSPDITITVEKWESKEVPVRMVYEGVVPEDYLDDRDNALLDYEVIGISGPASVVEQIDRAEIYVDMQGRTESISESFQYTLCDKEGNPVDAALITADTARVRLDLTIQRFKELPVVYTLAEGGGATEANVKITLDTPTIRVSGSSAILEELEQINLGTIDLAAIDENTTKTYPVKLPEGVINLTGVNEVNVAIDFNGLNTREFIVENIRVVGVPAGMEYELVTKRLTVVVRGPDSKINQMTAHDLVVTADISGKTPGTLILNASVDTTDPAYEGVGALGTISVSVTLRESPEKETT
ncbi:MAG: hypothetical protein IJZ39_06395 [Oscillospiraceae bacterium]|nr:hypothetical protein [Oscillospiraceae bacterium]